MEARASIHHIHINVDIQVITISMSQSTTSLFRRLAWQSSVTLEIRFAEDGPGGGGVPEVYYVSRGAIVHPYLFPLHLPPLTVIDKSNILFQQSLLCLL